MITEEVTQAQLKDLEKFADRLLNKFNVDIEFTKHFADRMNDDRNKPAIKISELQAFFKKIAKVKAKNIKAHVNSEVVLKDLQKDLNLPVAINLDKQGDIEVTHKTIMRKKNFTTPNQVIQYEEKNELVKIHSPGHKLHGKTGRIFYKHADGRVNVQVSTAGVRRPDVTNITLKPHEFKNMNEETSKNELVKIHSPGHKLHGKTGRIFYKHADGRVNVQVSTAGVRRPDVTNITLKPHEFKNMNEELATLLYPMSETAKFALLRKSEESGYVVEVLEDVYTRGLAAYDSEKHSKLLPEQYAFARINSFIKGGKARLMDADLIDDRRTFKEWTLENPESGWHSTKNKRVIPLKHNKGMYTPHDVKDTEMLRAVTGKHTLSADDLKYAHGAAHRQGYKLDVVKDK